MENYPLSNIFPSCFRHTLKSKEWKHNICNDEVIGFIYKEKSTIVFKRRDDYNSLFVGVDQHDEYCKENGIKPIGKISLILESPHVDEFLSNNLDVYKMDFKYNARPANAATGHNIDRYIVEVHHSKLNNIKDGVYSLSLINSIQQQCSLGVNTLYYRDRVWVYCWFSNINDLIPRLNKLKPEIILICPTVGEHYCLNYNVTGYDLSKKKAFTKKFIEEEFEELELSIKGKVTIKSLIKDAIRKEYPEAKIFVSTHPSSWWSSKNRKSHKVS